MNENQQPSPYKMEGRLPMKQAIPLGLQHVLAMFVGNLTPILIICGGAGLMSDHNLMVVLIQNAMLIAGLVTLIQIFTIGAFTGEGLFIFNKVRITGAFCSGIDNTASSIGFILNTACA